MLSSFILTTLVAAAAAVPTGSNYPSCSKVQQQNANFDDLTGVPGNQYNTIPTGYKGLYFQGFTFDTGINLGGGVQPGLVQHSAPNYAQSSVLTTTLAGSAEWTTNYQSSTIKSFTPQSFYYGCIQSTQNGASGLPTACNIAITGFAKGDNTAEAVQVAAQEFSYNPTTLTGQQQMAFGAFNSAFANVQYVLIQYSLPGGMAALQPNLAFFIDDVKFTTCSY